MKIKIIKKDGKWNYRVWLLGEWSDLDDYWCNSKEELMEVLKNDSKQNELFFGEPYDLTNMEEEEE